MVQKQPLPKQQLERIAFEIAPDDKLRFQYFVQRYGNMSSVLKHLVIEFNAKEEIKQGPYPGEQSSYPTRPE